MAGVRFVIFMRCATLMHPLVPQMWGSSTIKLFSKPEIFRLFTKYLNFLPVLCLQSNLLNSLNSAEMELPRMILARDHCHKRARNSKRLVQNLKTFGFRKKLNGKPHF